MKVLMVAAIAAGLQSQTYVVHAHMPRGETVSATARVAENPGDATISAGGRDRAIVVEILTTSNAVAQAAIAEKSTAQIMVGPQRTCVDLKVTRNGNSISATGSVMMPPPPQQQDGGPQQQPPPQQGNGREPRGDAQMNVRIVETLDGERVASAHGDVGPDRGPGPHFVWSLERKGE